MFKIFSSAENVRVHNFLRVARRDKWPLRKVDVLVETFRLMYILGGNIREPLMSKFFPSPAHLLVHPNQHISSKKALYKKRTISCPLFKILFWNCLQKLCGTGTQMSRNINWWLDRTYRLTGCGLLTFQRIPFPFRGLVWFGYGKWSWGERRWSKFLLSWCTLCVHESVSGCVKVYLFHVPTLLRLITLSHI